MAYKRKTKDYEIIYIVYSSCGIEWESSYFIPRAKNKKAALKRFRKEIGKNCKKILFIYDIDNEDDYKKSSKKTRCQ